LGTISVNSVTLPRSTTSDEILREPETNLKIRVTYIIGSLRDGGTERQVLELIRHLDRSRFDPSLVSMEPVNVERARDIVGHCFVLGLPQAGNSRWVSRSASLLKAVHTTKKHLQHIRSDIVHAFLPGPCILGGFAARLAGIPVVIGSRRSLLSQYRRRSVVGGWADTAAFRLAHFNLGNSEAVTTEMVTVGKCSQSMCGKIYNGVDLQRFRPNLPSSLRQQLGWTHDEVVFGMIANFRPCKRHGDFVDAAAIIACKHDNARFVMVGADNGTKEDVRRKIEALSLNDKVRVLDSTASPELVFAALDVYVSASDSEGFSNVLLEAMSCGKPVIATRAGGNQEAVEHGISGLLVCVNNPQDLAEAGMLLLSDPALRQKLGAAGRERVERNFSIEAMVHAHEGLYLRLFDAHRERVWSDPYRKENTTRGPSHQIS
jgi:glycosyltransferase involved in cell wall biosynthesis